MSRKPKREPNPPAPEPETPEPTVPEAYDPFTDWRTAAFIAFFGVLHLLVGLFSKFPNWTWWVISAGFFVAAGLVYRNWKRSQQAPA